MTRTIEHTDAAAWRSIRLGGAPLVPLEIESPRAVIAVAMTRLREMRREAQLRVGGLNENECRVNSKERTMTMTNDEKKLLMARQRMTATAAGLHHVLGAFPAAGLLIGAACGVLTTEFGHAKAAEYLREVADAIEADDGDADQATEGRLQ